MHYEVKRDTSTVDLLRKRGPGRAVVQAKDRRWLSPGRSRMGSPAAAAAAEPLR